MGNTVVPQTCHVCAAGARNGRTQWVSDVVVAYRRGGTVIADHRAGECGSSQSHGDAAMIL
mgnify:FL=1